jgi:hypothetical protein
MPLIQSGSREAVSENIRREMAANKPQKQAVAIALDVARRAKKRAAGGQLKPASWQTRSEARGMLHSGPIMSAVPGRTDRHNMKVGAGSYIVPADVVSHLGQNNSAAGMAVLNHMFSQSPYGGKPMAMARGKGAPAPPKPMRTSTGGSRGEGSPEPVEIITAGGEYTIPPEVVTSIGGGDMDHGHKILDEWVLSTRKQHIKTLRKLPKPAKD